MTAARALIDDWRRFLAQDRRRSVHTVRAYVATAERLVEFLQNHRGGGVTQAMLATPPKDQILLKLDSEGRVKLLSVFPKGENGKERPGDLNWVHTMAVAADGTIYFGDVQGRRAQKFVPVGKTGS